MIDSPFNKFSAPFLLFGHNVPGGQVRVRKQALAAIFQSFPAANVSHSRARSRSRSIRPSGHTEKHFPSIPLNPQILLEKIRKIEHFPKPG
jgi:hypothetical protein